MTYFLWLIDIYDLFYINIYKKTIFIYFTFFNFFVNFNPISLNAATALIAASPIESDVTTGFPDAAKISLAESTLVPSSRHTTGQLMPNSAYALLMPRAIISQSTIPPKMLTKMTFTFGSLVIILNASKTPCSCTPPPRSKKLAGSPPSNFTMSMVAMASPAPLTKQPISPSRLI